jgi:hypothetical protein
MLNILMRWMIDTLEASLIGMIVFVPYAIYLVSKRKNDEKETWKNG